MTELKTSTNDISPAKSKTSQSTPRLGLLLALAMGLIDRKSVV